MIFLERAIRTLKAILNKLFTVFYPRVKHPKQTVKKERRDLEKTETTQIQEKIQKSEEKGVKEQIKKPYKKKPPTEGKERRTEKLSSNKERESTTFERRENIDLGRHIRKKRLKLNEPPPQKKKISRKNEIAERVCSPYVEINFDEAKIYLVLPQQQFRIDSSTEIPQQLIYNLKLNGEEQKIVAKVISNQTFARVEEKRIYLEKPLEDFQIVFPTGLQNGIYNYHHKNRNFYAFFAIGSNLGRIHYLYDENGNLNPIPQKVVWVLLS